MSTSPEVKIRLSLDGAQQVQQGTAGAAASFDKLETVLESIAGSTRLSAESLQMIANRLGGIQAVATGASQAIRQVDAEAEALKSTSTTAAAAIDKVSASVAAVGTQARSTAGDLKALERTNEAVGANLQKVGAASAAINQQSRTAAGGLQSLTAAQAAVGAQSKLTGNQVSQLSNQIQDFFIQVQSGGSPLTAFLQQGSQLSAMFGGFGNAFRAVTSLISPMVVALTAGAAAVGILLAAYNQGAGEADAFVRGIVLSGNAAGVTTSQLRELARAQDDVVGTQGKAADVLARLVATGNVAAGSIGKIAEATTRLEREGVGSLDEIVKKFDALGRAPLATLLKLNEAENFLTKAIYDQVRALEKRGQLADAARVAQEAYADASITRTRQLEEQLGTIERGWRAITETAKEAWDAMLAVGRKQTPLDQLQVLQKELAANERRTDRADSYDPASGRRRTGADGRRQEILDQIRDLQASVYWTGALAAAQAKAAADTKTYTEAQTELERSLKRAAEEQQRQVAAGKALAQQMALTEAGFSGSFLEDWKKLEVAHKAGALSADAYAQAHDRLIKQQPVLQAMAKAAFDAATAVQAARKAESDGIDAYLRQQKDAAIAAVQSARDRRNALQDEEQAAALAQATNISLARAIETVAIARLQERLQQLDGESPAAKALRDEIALRREVLTLMGRKETREANVQAARDAGAAWQRMADDAGAALTNAIMTGGRSAGEQLKAYFKSLVLRPIVEAAVSPLTGAIAAFLSGGGASAGGGNAAAMAGLNNASTLVSLYQAATGYSGGVNALAAYLGAGQAAGASSASLAYANAVGAAGGDSLGALIAGNGSWAGVGTSAGQLAASESATLFASQAAGEGITVAGGTSGAAGGGSSTMGAWGAYAAYAAMIYAAAQYASKLYGEGFTGSKQLEGKSWYDYSDKAINREVFEAIGLSEKWTEILSGSVRWNHMFGRAEPRVTDQGFRGTIGGGDFSGEAFRDIKAKGGLFRSDKNWTETAALSGEIERFLDDAAQSVMGQAKKFGEALGLPAQELASVTTQVRVTLTDDVEKNKAEIAKALGQYGDALIAGWADEIEPLKIYGETVAQTINRVGGAIVGVNQILEALGVQALQASVSGGQAALQLGQLFGGIDKLGAAAGSYASKFFSEAERTSMQAEAIAKSLAGVSLTMPATREGFRALVEAQDLSTEAGRRAFTVLLASADAFDAVAASAERASEKLAQEAAARAKALDDAIAKNLPKFLSPSEQRMLQFQQIQGGLAQAGVSIGLEQIMGASKADILAFASAFINLKDGASAAEIAVANAAGALADMADEALQAADDARKTAADRAADRAARQASLNDAFDNLVAGLKQGVVSAYADVQQVIGAERQRAQGEAEKAISALEQQAERITHTYSDLIGSLGDAAQQLSDDLAGDGGRGRALGTLQGALADLRAGRDVDADAVRSAAGTAARVDPAGFGSAFEFRKAQAPTANLLREVSAAARQQQTTALGAIAEQQVKVEAELEKQLTKLDDQLKEARSAAGSLANIDSGVQTVAGAIARLAESMNAVKAVEGAGGPTGQWVASGGNEVWASDGGAVAARPAGATLDGTIIRGLKSTFTAADAVAFVQDRLAAGDITGLYWRAVAEGIDSSSLDALMNWAPGTALAEALKRGLPAFATGSPYIPNTGLALVHQGERIIPAAENAVLMRLLSESGGGGGGGQAAVVAELRAQLAEARAMHDELMDAIGAVSDNTNRAARSTDDIASGQVVVRVREVTA